MKKWQIGIGILIIVLIATFFIRGIPQNTTSSNTENKNENIETNNLNSIKETNNQNEETTKEKIMEKIEEETMTKQEIEKHNNQEDCWIVYEGKIYDITDYIPRHPGGEDKIARNCGTTNKFQEEFTKKHGTTKVSLLMKIGTFIGDFDIIGNIE